MAKLDHEMPTWRRPRLFVVGVVGGVALLATTLLAACGGGSSKSPAAGSSPSPAAAQSTGSSGRVGGTVPPGTFGTAAAVSPGSVEVQNPSTGQVTVKYTASTKFSQTKSVSESAVTAGECVTAAAAASSGSSSSAAAPTSRPTSFTATTVAISKPVNGSCAGVAGFGGGAGRTRPSGAPSSFPTGARTSGAARPGAFGDFATGKVTSVSGSTIVLQVSDRATKATRTDTITVTPSTRYTETVAATSAALKVGECITASGPSDSTGAVTANRIGVSTPGSNGCTAGFGRRGGANG